MVLGGSSSILSVKVFPLRIVDFPDVVICNIVTYVDHTTLKWELAIKVESHFNETVELQKM